MEMQIHSTENPTPSALSMPAAPVLPRLRRYRKRTRLKHVPKMSWPVNALWEAASPEEQLRAHKLCMAMLELWLGKTSKQEVSDRLGIPLLRIWQLSQQALAGMTVGLLKQPRSRPRGRPVLENPESNTAELRRQLAQKEKELQVHVGLVALLRQLPLNRPRSNPELIREVPSKEEKNAVVRSDDTPRNPLRKSGIRNQRRKAPRAPEPKCDAVVQDKSSGSEKKHRPEDCEKRDPQKPA